MVNCWFKLLLAIPIIVLLCNCSYDPQNEYVQKKKIGVFGQNQGMVTFEGYLYNDSTFYIPAVSSFSYTEGKFEVHDDYLYFERMGGEKYFDKVKLKFERKSNSPFYWEPGGSINYIEFYKE